MTRICIAGGPQVGKTTLARELDPLAYSTDARLLGLPWGIQSDAVVGMLAAEGPWVIEGVPVIRALRKWLRSHPEGQPCDTLYWRFESRGGRSGGQEALAKGCLAVYEEIRPELERRGVEIRTF